MTFRRASSLRFLKAVSAFAVEPRRPSCVLIFNQSTFRAALRYVGRRPWLVGSFDLGSRSSHTVVAIATCRVIALASMLRRDVVHELGLALSAEAVSAFT